MNWLKKLFKKDSTDEKFKEFLNEAVNLCRITVIDPLTRRELGKISLSTECNEVLVLKPDFLIPRNWSKKIYFDIEILKKDFLENKLDSSYYIREIELMSYDTIRFIYENKIPGKMSYSVVFGQINFIKLERA